MTESDQAEPCLWCGRTNVPGYLVAEHCGDQVTATFWCKRCSDEMYEELRAEEAFFAGMTEEERDAMIESVHHTKQ
jgi:hypothetical protein